MLIGAHCGGGVKGALDKAVAMGADAVQLFTQSPRAWKPPTPNPELYEAFRAQREETAMGAVLCHAIYLVNLAAPNDEVYEKSVAVMRSTMDIACAIEADGVVFHVGSHLGAGFEHGLERVLPAMEQVLERCSERTWLLMENSAGAGATIGRSIEELATLFEKLDRHPRLGVCLDSCHLYVSGYDVTDPDAVAAVLAELDDAVGLDRLRCLHVNDSKSALGSNSDRHDNILDGVMGEDLGAFLAHPKVQGLPAILEVPGRGRQGPERGRAPQDARAARSLDDLRRVRRYSREDPEVRLPVGQLEELRVDAAEVVRAGLVGALDLGVAHRQRLADRPHRAEPAVAFGRLELVEVDLDRVDLLQAADVAVAVRLVGVEERARLRDAGRGVHDLVAVHLTAPTLDLVLGPQGEGGGGLLDVRHSLNCRHEGGAAQDLTERLLEE